MKFTKYIDNEETIPTWDFSEEFAYFVMNDGVEGELKINGLLFINRDNTLEVDIHCLIFKPYKGEGIYDVDRMQEKEIEQFIIKEFNKKNSTQIDKKIVMNNIYENDSLIGRLINKVLFSETYKEILDFMIEIYNLLDSKEIVESTYKNLHSLAIQQTIKLQLSRIK